MPAVRLIVLLSVVIAAVLLWAALSSRTRRFRAGTAADLLPSPPGTRALVIAFTTPDCAPCRTAQKPALERLHLTHPHAVDVREVDATVDPALAERFGILSVPSTVVIASNGRVVAINHTLAAAAKLTAQLGLNGVHPP
ncbi:MAG TPA: thioredoxin family protein [bacterium]|jgi:thioredoxin 1